MNIEQAYKIYVASLDVLEPQLGEELAFAIDRIIDHQANRAEQAEDKLDRTELAEVKARMEVEHLATALQKIHTEFTALAMTAEMNQVQLFEQLERLQQTSIFRALAEIDRLRGVLEYYANADNYVPKDDLCQHEMDLDGGHKARKALEGLNEQG